MQSSPLHSSLDPVLSTTAPKKGVTKSGHGPYGVNATITTTVKDPSTAQPKKPAKMQDAAAAAVPSAPQRQVQGDRSFISEH